MEGWKLLTRARSAGLTVEVQGDELVVRGPMRAADIAKELLRHKAAVMAVLSPVPSSLPPGPAQPSPLAKYTRANPARVTAKGNPYDVAQTHGMWFFQLAGHPEAGWTNCSGGFVELIEEQLEPEGRR
jgi:hypothetical protein